MKRRRSVIAMAIGLAAATIAAGRAESAPKALDVVDLADGAQIVGVVTHREPGKYVTVVTAAGEQHMIPWVRLKQAAGASPGASASPASPAASAAAAPSAPPASSAKPSP